MSLKDNPCRKFQANIFNKSKCQNCFKPRESHLLNDEDLNQAKPIYGGWLLLAPEGTNFDNPLHRSRKWQRRFFILYEHGLLRYALDEMPSTLPQGTINMNQCSDVVDGEARTGQKNSLCLLTPDNEHFIRAECKEIINGWQEALTVYPRTNKQNQKKKRKVDAPTQQEPGPAKVTVTSGAGGGLPCLAGAERVPTGRSSLWQEEHRWSRAAIPCSRSASCISQLSHGQPDAADAATRDDGGAVSTGRKARVESGYFSLEKTKSEPPPQHQPPQHLPPSTSASSSSSSSLGALSPRRSQIIGRFEEGQPAERMDTGASNEPPANTPATQRQGRSERRYLANKHEISLDAGKDRSGPDVSGCTYAYLRRAKSLDRRVTESAMTPDLLNFKKGWMTKLYDDGMWKKHWFVLTDHSLRYYKDSIAEEASELDGEIDLSTCYDVKEFPVQRNYGFQILCKEEACTLSAMTSGIRRNWIQAIMKNVRPATAPDVTRKNVSLKLSVLKPRSLADEKALAHVTLEPCPQAASEPSPGPGAPEPGRNGSPPSSEPRKSRVRERRREGRSKTFDWTEFKAERSEEPPKGRADAVDLSSSFSPASSCCSPSSSASSLASSPISTSSLPTSSAGGRRAPGAETERATHKPNSVTVTGPPAPSAAPPLRGVREPAGMEVDRHGGEDERGDGTSVVREEIEQRWHQVERTPLREEKQVPINTAPGNSDRLPAHELAALLDKELGQKQQELDRLQKQNNVLKEQLEDALGKELSARDGYVLQNATPPPPSSTHRVPWQCLHSLNQDLQGELETQKHKQDLAQQQIRTLKRSYTEAQDAVDHHEAGIQALQSKLASAMAEILASEQAVARMRNELKLEQRRSREQEEEHGRGEATLRAQLKDSEDRLRDVEASLLERNQALRQLEHQQALQRDHAREVQRLQERLQEVTARLSATEEGHALKEERLRREQHGMRESHESERQNLCRRLAEAEALQKETQGRLSEAEQQVEALLRGRQASGGKEVLKLREELAQKADAVESLRESTRRLEEERGHLTCRCQELLNQIAEADREVNKLRSRLETEEADYYTLEHSYERATQEFQKISQVLGEKEEEIRQTKEMYERLVQRKEEDLKEALVKMAALGSSLEETEHRLQAKEELLCQMGPGVLEKLEPCGAEKDLKAKLVVAKDRIAELEQHLGALQLGYADLRVEKPPIPEQSKKARLKTSASLSANGERLLPFDDASKTDDFADDKESQAKRPRIRFSSIQGQKYMNLEGLDASHLSGASADAAQKVHQDVTEGPMSSETTSYQSSDPEKFISIIHSLEAKLLATENKLRDLTQHLEEQGRAQAEGASKPDPAGESGRESATQSGAANEQYANALLCVESSREKVRAILGGGGERDTADSRLHSLSEIESDLLSASLHMRRGHAAWEQRSPSEHRDQSPEALDGEALQVFAKTLSFEAVVLDKMASLMRTSKSDVSHSLADMWEDVENIKGEDRGCSAVVYADALTRKLLSESSSCNDLEEAQTDDVSADVDVDAAVIFNTIVKAELAYSIHNLKLCYEDKLKLLKRELTLAHDNLHHRDEALKAIIEASQRPDWKNVIKEIKNEFGFSRQKLADVPPPELAPYAEQLETEEARGLAEEIVDRHLAAETATRGAEPIRSLQDAHEQLAAELRRHAAVLHTCAQQIQRGGDHPGLHQVIRAALGRQASRPLAAASLCMRDALVQAQVAYVACRLRALHQQDLDRCRQTGRDMGALVQRHAGSVAAVQERYEASLEDERQNFARAASALQTENHALRSEISKRVNQLSQQQKQMALLEERFKKEAEELRQVHVQELSRAEKGRASTQLALMEATSDSQRKLQVLLVDMGAMEERHEGHARELEEQFERRIRELQRIHEQEIEKLNLQYTESTERVQKHQGKEKEEAATPMEEEEQGDAELDSMLFLKDRVQELEAQMSTMRDELENKHLEGDAASLREKYQRDFESLKATCERGFAAMEDTHQKVVHDLQRQHQREISKLMEERERLLAEETAATIAAIEAMKNAHKEELEKTHRSQLSGLNSDIDELRLQYEEELQSIHRELEVLSEQYSQKCLENAHLSQALEAERQALRQCQRENQELNAHNQELNNRLTTEISRMRSCFSGETVLSPLSQGSDVYELEVLLRIKESEIQYLKQEIHSLKDELQSALRDKKYATDKYKGIYTELSIAKAKADCDIGKLKEKLLVATEALGERAVDGAVTSGYDIMKSKSNPDILTNERASTSKQSRGIRSKSLKEGLTVQERMKLFEAKDSKKI